jgi:uncharacterized protein YggU (UPF0235/DUF167 family)
MFSLALRLRPGASRTAVGGGYDGPYGRALVVAVPARAVDGKATEAAVRAVADALGLRPRDISVKSGHASRDKLVVVDAPPPDLAARVVRLRDLAGPA